jgi:RNA polymerase sigma-70 factor (ECF subfamily)
MGPVGEHMTPSDRSTSLTLLERIRNRDEEAWRRLVHIYGPLVEQWCGHRGVRGQDADDVRQEVFQAVSTGLDGFRRDRPGDTFRGWLRGITRFKLLDYYRRHQAQPEAQGGTDAHNRLQQVADQDLPDDTADDLGGLYRRALELVRGEFESQTWQAFWRAAVEGHTPADIARDLGVSPAAVRKAKSRVLLRLRQEVGDLIT